MSKDFLLVFSISLLFIPSNGVYLNPNNNYSSPNNINRNCVPLSNCPEYLWLLRNKHDVPGMGFQEVLQYLQSQQCGFDGNHPKVTCPRTEEDMIEDPVSVGYQEARMGGVVSLPGSESNSGGGGVRG